MKREEIKKNKLRILANKKGFTSKFLYDGEYKYAPEKEKLRWLFWKTELRQWINEETNETLNVFSDSDFFNSMCENTLNNLPDKKF